MKLCIKHACILSSESDISNDEESNYTDKEDVLLCTNSCLSPSLWMMNQRGGTKSTTREQIQ